MTFSITDTADEIRRHLSSAFGKQGVVSKMIPNFEERPQQQEMALLAWDALSGMEHLLVEAGTGVGKSLAYLMPLAFWCLTTKKRAIISTYTVNLQQQLVNKDIPIIADIFDKTDKTLGSLKYTLFKGRSHYLCLRKWKRLYGELESKLQLVRAQDDDHHLLELSRLIDEGTWRGDREQLPFHLPNSLWNELCSDSNRCMSGKCPFRETCFYFKQRRHLETCHLIVVNHALFAAHLRVYQETGGKTSLLPGYEGIIFDEAHHLETVFRDSMTFGVGANHLKRLADDTVRLISRNPLSKLLDIQERKRVESALDHVSMTMDSALARLSPEAAYKGSGRTPRRGFRDYQYSMKNQYRLKEPNSVDDNIAKSLRELSKQVSEWGSLDLSDEERFEINALSRRYLGIAGQLENINTLEGDGDTFVYWSEIEGRGRQKHVTVNGSPLEVGAYLAENLWLEIPCAILTSATLSTGGSFDYIRRLLDIEAKEALIGSPFDYHNQACLCIPQDVRGRQPNSPVFDDYVSEMILEIVSLAQGRTFVLFTARRSLETVSGKIRGKIEEKGYPVFVQGDMPRESLLREFKTSGNGVLMGLDSFWEGVDVPGEALSCVVLAKLPFPVPEGPVMKAREALWKTRGLNPFTHYSLPVASLKLKQGFGRLIRSKTDRGAVVILDSRITFKAYGRTILKSLPPARLSTDLNDIARAVPPPNRE